MSKLTLLIVGIDWCGRQKRSAFPCPLQGAARRGRGLRRRESRVRTKKDGAIEGTEKVPINAG